jgi:hypothetical protein
MPKTPPGAPVPPPEDPTLEDVATFLVTTFVHNAAGAAIEMVQQTATAFEKSLDTAIHGNYSANCFAKDTALLWARNVDFITRLFSPGSPSASSSTPPPAA